MARRQGWTYHEERGYAPLLVTTTPNVAGDNSNTSFSWSSCTACVLCLRAKNRDGLADRKSTGQCFIKGPKSTCDHFFGYLRNRPLISNEERFPKESVVPVQEPGVQNNRVDILSMKIGLFSEKALQ